jgi:hypothetical protein
MFDHVVVLDEKLSCPHGRAASVHRYWFAAITRAPGATSSMSASSGRVPRDVRSGRSAAD